MKDIYNYLAEILGVDSAMLGNLDNIMIQKTGKEGVMDRVFKENEKNINNVLKTFNSSNRETFHVLSTLRKTIFNHERQFLDFLKIIEDGTEFEKSAKLAKKITKVKKGFFLKKERAEQILKKCQPKNLLKYLNISDINKALGSYDIMELFAALRFMESEEWMHETFDKAYGDFKISDFEEREIEVKILSPIWRKVGEKFVAQKYHNVSHLKEFGVIFLNPIREDMPGKFLRDFALILHYFHEIDFYSKLFKKYLPLPNFSENFRMFLRGDNLELDRVEDGEWLIIQNYLAKNNAQDKRLLLPRVNSESLHWMRGEDDLIFFASKDANLDLRLWYNLDWVGGIFEDGKRDVISFDLEDNVMSLVTSIEGPARIFNYHQREAMWLKIFSEYAGGEEEVENLLLNNFKQGIIKF